MTTAESRSSAARCFLLLPLISSSGAFSLPLRSQGPKSTCVTMTPWQHRTDNMHLDPSSESDIAGVSRLQRPQGRGGRRRPVLTAAATAAAAPGPQQSETGNSSVFVESYNGLAKHRVAWDHRQKRFRTVIQQSARVSFLTQCSRLLRHSFLPEDVTPDYYNYTKWRVLQRLISATVSVFGTRALLLALGLRTERVGVTATFNWIQKDAFGKLGRIMWASKMSRRFDSDAKRWRFRSSLLFAMGTGLEVLTYIFPAAFLYLATVANTFKQMSMLTSSATRNAMYKSFAGDSQTLGDITAKGEAQIAVVDLLGIVLGITLSKMIGTAQIAMGIGYVLLSMLDILAIYNEIRSVVFNSLNLERATLVTRAYVQGGVPAIPNPQSMARHERIFLAPRYINHAIFRTISRTGVSYDRLDRLRRSFGSESFLVTWSAGVGTSIVLHGRAGEGDILKALLTWGYFVEGFRKEKGGEDAWEEAAVEALRLARRNEEGFVRALTARDWNMRQMVFGKIRHRTDW